MTLHYIGEIINKKTNKIIILITITGGIAVIWLIYKDDLPAIHVKEGTQKQRRKGVRDYQTNMKRENNITRAIH
jgi:hypothetical protein